MELGEVAVLTMSSNITAGIMELINPFQKSLTMEQTGHRLPIVSSLSDVTSEMGNYSRACIVSNEKLILVWSTSPETIMEVGSDVEMQLFTLVIKIPINSGIIGVNFDQLSGHDTFSPTATNFFPASQVPRSRATSIYSHDGKPATSVTSKRNTVRGALDEDNEVYMKAVALEEGATEEDDDLEGSVPVRPIARLHSVKIALAMMLVVFTQAVGISKVGSIITLWIT